MDVQELMFTQMVLERAKKLRMSDNEELLDDPDAVPPNLEPYVKQAVEELKAWYMVVMRELNS